MTWYNQTRQVEELLAKTESEPASFTIHLHAEHWVLNNGSKFLYNNYAASLLDDIRAHQLPVDFLDLFDASPNIHFYDGCLIAELVDYRPQKANDPPLEKPPRTRTVLHPTPESLWADVCKIAAAKKQQEGLAMTDRDALEIESRILLATAPPLCLDPDPHLTRMVNHIVRVSTPTVPTSLKRKASAVDQEEDETDKARRAKIMQFMNSRATRVPSANYRILDAIQRSKQAKESKGTDTPQPQQPPVTVTPSATQSPAPSATETPAPQHNPPAAEQEDPAKSKPKPKTEPPPSQITFAKPAVPHPPPATHQFHAQNQTTKASNTPSPRTRTPQSFPAQESVPRISTPSKQQQPSHNQSPRVQQQVPQAIQPAKAQTPHPVTYQPPIQNQTQFIHQNPAANTRVTQAKAAAAHNQNTVSLAAAAAAVRSATPAQQQQQQQHNMAAAHLTPQQQQHILQQHLLQQRLLQQQQQQQSGRASTAPTTQGNAMHGTPVPARATPMGTNQRIASRSPMPPQPQVQAQQATPQMAHPQQPQINFQQYNTAAAAGYRGLAHANTSSPRPQPTNVSSRAPQSNTDASAQQPQQTQIHYPQMYGYPQMQMSYRGMPMNAAYWMRPGMVVNGQIHGMQPNQQQQQQQQQQAQQMMMQMKPPANPGR
ncbi:Spt20 family-domain-containing protein [Desarmillaria tabescens]|uniref:Spt20 family-domain-containing protein n=1 Tax=Armillaria tabescens TaxID=1929756 RepID=A0AA39KB37_ARMTA|nr:Spt20 family-domain-containing protein [Desarmillaria tabescens]KAK0457889.1 Spt20 family-domain-containing protein [Desarmillaria tabescens]